MKTYSINNGLKLLPVVASVILLAFLFISGCGAETGESEDGDENSDGDAGSDGDSDSEVQSDGDSDASGDEPEADGDETVEEEVIGAFAVTMIPPEGEGEEAVPGYTSFYGKIYDGPTPQQIVWEEAAAEGSCRLLKPRVPYCPDPCEGGAVCVEDDVCRAFPASQNIGTVHVTGIMNNKSETEFDLDPVSNGYQTTSLPYPAFAEGDDITVSALDSDFSAAFSLQTRGIAPFSLDNENIAVRENQPISLSWAGASVSGISSVFVKLDISHHGGSKGKIECRAEDSGSLEIPADMVSELLALGVAGFPTIVVARQSVARTALDAGLVELTISSSVERSVEIEGLVSCNDDEDCPEGQTCQTSLKCE